MQLFITDYIKKDTTLFIENEELLLQLRKVLRASIWDTFFVQSPNNEAKKTRYEVKITQWDKKSITWTIVDEVTNELSLPAISMIVAMPNKREKAELIVQKLTECGIDQIIFWPSERSIIKIWNSKKEERLLRIIKEAVEQSRGWKVPKIEFTTNITTHILQTEVFVFDKPGTMEQTNMQSPHPKTWIIGPEWWLTTKDYQLFEAYSPKIVSLGSTVLRMETAAIIGGWVLKNNYIF